MPLPPVGKAGLPSSGPRFRGNYMPSMGGVSRSWPARSWYVRKTGSNTNGGSSPTVRSTGTDGVTVGTNVFTSASASWTQADLYHGIYIGTLAVYRVITAVVDANTVVVSGATLAANTGITWTVGGAWLTVANAMNSARPLLGGDTVYIGPGTYRESNLAPGISGNALNPIVWWGDWEGVYTGDTAGEVRITSRTTNDTSNPAATTTLNLANCSWMIFRGLYLIGGNAGPMTVVMPATSNNITFRNCAILGLANGTSASDVVRITTGTTGANHLFERCIIADWMFRDNAGDYAVHVISPTAGGGNNFNVGVIIRACVIFGRRGGVSHDCTSTTPQQTTGLGGGVVVEDCTIWSAYAGVNQTDYTGPAAFPMQVRRNILIAATGTYSSNIPGGNSQISENWNLILANTARTNVTAGANSQTAYFIDMSGAEVMFGYEPLPMGTVRSGAPLTYITSSTVGVYNRYLDAFGRPFLGAVGAPSPSGGVQPQYASTQDTAHVVAGSYSANFSGPGISEFQVPVDPADAPITFSIQVYRDGTYSGPTPSMQLSNGLQAGVVDQQVSDTGAINQFNTISLSPFIPTAKGLVTIRLVSWDTNGSGGVWFDAFAQS